MVDDATTEAIRRLRHFDGKSWLPLPDWARFLIGFGANLASKPRDASRVIAAVSTPSRAYAAAFVSTGIVTKHFEDPIEDATCSHLEYLKSLPEGTTVTYRRGLTGSKMAKGWLLGCVVDNNIEYIKIRDSQDTVHWTPARLALFVQPADAALDTLPRSIRHRSVDPVSGLARFTPANDALSRFVQHSRLDCLLVGVRARLHDEIVGTDFAIERRSGKLTEGNLHDILGVREFGKESDIYHSRIVAAGSRSTSELALLDPSLIVFDGARSLIRWRNVWPNAGWIFVGDRTGRRFDEAAAIINDAYVRRVSDIEGDELPSPPAGIESVAFRVRVNA